MHEIKYITSDELFKDSQPSNSFEEARNVYLAEQNPLIDAYMLRQLEDECFIRNRGFY